jgi:3-oxoacyl-[acyl-carrier-protein] synthase-3
MRAKIVSTGSYLPEKILTNQDLEKMVDTNDEWIVQRTGIKVRHIAKQGETTSDLAYKAALDALNSAKVDPMEIDAIIVATVTPDKPLPATALFVQEKLGAKNAFGFDLNAACSGFMYALSVADGYIRSNLAKRVLVIGAETLSRITDYEDRGTCVIFSDGAACVLLEATDNDDEGLLSIKLHSDGHYTDLMEVPAGGSYKPCSKEAIDNRDVYIKMKGNETFKMAVRHLISVSKEVLDNIGIEFSDIDLMISHQANRRIIEGVARRAKLPDDKVIITIDQHANTAAASIPLALDWANKNGKIKKGDIVLLNSFGASLTWSAGVIRW